MSAKSLNPAGIGPIVSSAHLAEGAFPALSEFEFGLILASHAFHRWMLRCISAAGVSDLSPLDVLILHTVNHRGRAKRLADICLVLSIEETHLVSYGVKKLEGAGLVASGRLGKEKTVVITDKGREICTKYGEIRNTLLVKPLASTNVDKDQLSEIAAMMRALSGHYDQAARAAASL
ncbi:MAG: winged helix DNA-binding protein [Microvirga sp.]|nr:winged helix DNA-binding protein [Microvirga sp.]